MREPTICRKLPPDRPVVPVELLAAGEGAAVDHVGAVDERVGLRVTTLDLLEGGAPRHPHAPLRDAGLQEASPDAQQPRRVLGVLQGDSGQEQRRKSWQSPLTFASSMQVQWCLSMTGS